MRMISNSPRTTAAIARVLAKEVFKAKSLVVLGLVGELGAGKTTFIKAFIKGLGSKKKVTSPTFIILRRLPLNAKRDIYHIDAYRVKSKDLLQLGLKEVMTGRNIVLVEWAERVKKVLPKNTIWLKLEHGNNKNERYITINRR